MKTKQIQMKGKLSLLAVSALSLVMLSGCSTGSRLDRLEAQMSELQLKVAQNNADNANQLQQVKATSERTNTRLNKLRDSLNEEY